MISSLISGPQNQLIRFHCKVCHRQLFKLCVWKQKIDHQWRFVGIMLIHCWIIWIEFSCINLVAMRWSYFIVWQYFLFHLWSFLHFHGNILHQFHCLTIYFVSFMEFSSFSWQYSSSISLFVNIFCFIYKISTNFTAINYMNFIVWQCFLWQSWNFD